MDAKCFVSIAFLSILVSNGRSAVIKFPANTNERIDFDKNVLELSKKKFISPSFQHTSYERKQDSRKVVNAGKLREETGNGNPDPIIKQMRTIYLPNEDILDPGLGWDLFKKLPDGCFTFIDLPEYGYIEERLLYRKNKAFYDRIANMSDISSKLSGAFTIGATLGSKSNHLSSGKDEVIGTSIEIHTEKKRVSFDRTCFKNPDLVLKDIFMEDLDALPLTIDKPWSISSWLEYSIFLKKYGTHFITDITLGASVRQWVFAKASTQYIDEALRVKACLVLGLLDLKSCSGITQEEIEKYRDIHTFTNLETIGGKPGTRAAFLVHTTMELLEKLMNEGRENPVPVGYRYMAIWDILMTKFAGDVKRYAIARNMMQYYIGYKDFGCTLQEQGSLKLRYFQYLNGKANATHPTFQCMLINKGCHSNDDCHIGGAGTVTYCYGSSCFDYRSPPVGSKAAYVVAQTSKSGSYDEGLNNSCHYKAAFRARCTDNYFSHLSIWTGDL